MANEEHLKILQQGVEEWNKWRKENKTIQPNLSGADLSRADLERCHLSGADLSSANLIRARLADADLSSANLSFANLSSANLWDADLSLADLNHAGLNDAILVKASLKGANLNHASLFRANLNLADLKDVDLNYATLREADLRDAILIGANLSQAFLCDANLKGANLIKADLTDANLSGAHLVETNFTNATITGCRIYGISAWNVTLVDTAQHDLVISKEGEAVVTVDNLLVAQFIYLLLKNEQIRDVIDTIGKKGVLILGRFTLGRKSVLDALRVELRRLGYVPMLFDFVKPTDKDFTETIMTLAGLSCFIIADITNPKSSPLELQATVPNYMIPFVPIIEKGEEPFSMFKDLRGKFSWILDPLTYDSTPNLIKGLERAVVIPALKKHDELMRRKAEELPTRDIGDYLEDS